MLALLGLVRGLTYMCPMALGNNCHDDCNNRGLCTSPGPDGYCFCEWGSKGEDCLTYMCPMGDDPLTDTQVPRAFNLTTSSDEAVWAWR